MECTSPAYSPADTAACVERGIVATLWHEIDHLLLSKAAFDESLWLLTSTLPPVELLGTEQLPQLCRLHLSSAANMMATLRLLAPAAFADGDTNPDKELLAKLDSSVVSIASCLIDFQLFHLQRAALLAATSRRRSKVISPLSSTPVSSDHGVHTPECSASRNNSMNEDSCTESVHSTQ